MAASDAEKVIHDYFGAHDATRFFDAGSEFHDMSQAAPFVGPEAIGAMLQTFYEDAFSDAHAELSRLWASDEGTVTAEFVFLGTNTGSLMGNEPTGRTVRIPMCVVYEVEGEVIRRARLYYDTGSLAGQLGWIE